MTEKDTAAWLGAFLRDSLLGVSAIEVDVPAARLGKVHLPLAGESPVALVDVTAHRTARAGFLITDEALWIIADGRRVALSEILAPPTFRAGRGMLDTTAGPISIPAPGAPDAEHAIARAVEAAISFFAGFRSTRVDELVGRGPVSAAVGAHLLHRRGVVAEWALADERRAALRPLTRGMDHLDGERLLAVIEELEGGRGDEGVAITDRRIATRAAGETRSVRLSLVTGVELRHETDKSSLTVLAGKHSFTIVMRSSREAAPDLARWLDEVTRLAPETRMEASTRSWPPTEEAALAAALSARGELPDAHARELCARVDVLERNDRFGRGARGGKWLSPLSVADFVHALGIAMGAPARRKVDGAVTVLDFALRRPMNARGSSRRNISVLAPTGFEWVSLPKGPTVASMRAYITDLVGATGFGISGLRAREETATDEVMVEVERGLPALERELMRRRCAYGLDVRPAELAQIRNDVVARRIAALLDEC